MCRREGSMQSTWTVWVVAVFSHFARKIHHSAAIMFKASSMSAPFRPELCSTHLKQPRNEVMHMNLN